MLLTCISQLTVAGRDGCDLKWRQQCYRPARRCQLSPAEMGMTSSGDSNAPCCQLALAAMGVTSSGDSNEPCCQQAPAEMGVTSSGDSNAPCCQQAPAEMGVTSSGDSNATELHVAANWRRPRWV